MGKKIDPKQVEAALAQVTDESSFIQEVLIDLLDWPIDPTIKTVEEISYDWTKEELRAANLDKKIVDCRIRQPALPDFPWSTFIVEFKNPEVFRSGRGMTVPLRQVLSGLDATNALKMSEFLDYCKQRWPEGAAIASV